MKKITLVVTNAALLLLCFSGCIKDRIEPMPEGSIIFSSARSTIGGSRENIYYTYGSNTGQKTDQSNNFFLLGVSLAWGLDYEWGHIIRLSDPEYLNESNIEVIMDNGFVKKMNTGDSISASSTFQSIGGSSANLVKYSTPGQVFNPPWKAEYNTPGASIDSGYIGLRVKSQTGNKFYVWLKVEIKTSNYFSSIGPQFDTHYVKFEILEGGRWTVPNKPIKAGQKY